MVRTGVVSSVAALLVLASGACHPGEHRRISSTALGPAHPAVADSTAPEWTDSMLTLDSATVVVFWTSASDTLEAKAREEAAAELKATAAWAGDFLDGFRIPIVATHARGVYVDTPSGTRRFVDFRGLDYPFGFVLIDPGYPERFLTGMVGEDDLRDELVDYFDLEEGDSTAVLRTRGTVGPARTSSRAASSAAGAKGFCRKIAPGGSSPCWTMTSGVYPDM
jgi:hypothetical protein